MRRGRAAARPEEEGAARWKRGSSREAASPPSRSRSRSGPGPAGDHPPIPRRPPPRPPPLASRRAGADATRLDPALLPNEPSTWPRGPPGPPHAEALSPTMPASPGPVSSPPPPPLWGRRLGGPDQLRARNHGLRLRGRLLGGQKRSKARSGSRGSRVVGRADGRERRAQP